MAKLNDSYSRLCEIAPLELHIDFYKYKKILKIVLEIIKKICEDTKINVNKVRVQNVLPEVKSEEDKDSGVF